MDQQKLLHALNHASSKFRIINHEAGEKDGRLKGKETRGYGRLLHQLKVHGSLTQKELAEILEVRPQSLTSALEKLEGQGYIVRTRDDQDHRVQNVALSREGVKVETTLHEIRTRAAKQYFDILSSQEQEELLALLEKLLKGNSYD